MNIEIFENLFVLEAANNHLGSVDRGLRIIRDHGKVAKSNNIKAAIKLQFRDVDNFIQDEYKNSTDNRYISKTISTKLSNDNLRRLVNQIKNVGCIPMATPFDEFSVDKCIEFEMPVIKVASSAINDWPLLERIASKKTPTMISTGGASEKDIDDVVDFFEKQGIPLAINHCVSLYPSENSDLHLNQIDYLKQRYPGHVIGLSTHEYHDWHSSMLISYAKGARTWERHIDIDYEGVSVSKYNSLPNQCDQWFKAFLNAAEMCGNTELKRRDPSEEEIVYLDKLVRGVYAKKFIAKGTKIDQVNFSEYFKLAIPLLKSQISCREILKVITTNEDILVGGPLLIDNAVGFSLDDENFRTKIRNRGQAI